MFLEVNLEEVKDTTLDVCRPRLFALLEADVVNETIGVGEEDWLVKLLLVGLIEFNLVEHAEGEGLARVANFAIRLGDSDVRKLKHGDFCGY